MKLTEQKLFIISLCVFFLGIILMVIGFATDKAYSQTPTHIGTAAAVSNPDADVYNVYMLKSCLVKLQAVKGGETK